MLAVADLLVLTTDPKVLDAVWVLRGKTQEAMSRDWRNLLAGYTYTIVDMLVNRKRVDRAAAERELVHIYTIVDPFDRSVFEEAWRNVGKVNS
jgi:hypothetical protein